jgi:hypothetical protein
MPRRLHDFDATFVTRVKRQRGVISATSEVVSPAEQDVGMTAVPSRALLHGGPSSDTRRAWTRA